MSGHGDEVTNPNTRGFESNLNNMKSEGVSQSLPLCENPKKLKSDRKQREGKERFTNDTASSNSSRNTQTTNNSERVRNTFSGEMISLIEDISHVARADQMDEIIDKNQNGKVDYDTIHSLLGSSRNRRCKEENVSAEDLRRDMTFVGIALREMGKNLTEEDICDSSSEEDETTEDSENDYNSLSSVMEELITFIKNSMKSGKLNGASNYENEELVSTRKALSFFGNVMATLGNSLTTSQLKQLLMDKESEANPRFYRMFMKLLGIQLSSEIASNVTKPGIEECKNKYLQNAAGQAGDWVESTRGKDPESKRRVFCYSRGQGD